MSDPPAGEEPPELFVHAGHPPDACVFCVSDPKKMSWTKTATKRTTMVQTVNGRRMTLVYRCCETCFHLHEQDYCVKTFSFIKGQLLAATLHRMNRGDDPW